jgi:hypothetical protein
MKKYYDKILFLLGLAVLGIGVGIFYYKGGLPKSTPLPPMTLNGGAFEPIPSPNIEDKTADWETPPDQGEDRNEVNWIYSIFTPPKIWWEPGEGWTAIPPQGAARVIPFGITLIKAEKELYRVQCDGTSGKGDVSDWINFSDEETGVPFHLKVGEESPHHQIKVIDLTVGPKELPHGLVEQVANVTILDERTNQTLTLVSGELYSPTNNEYYVLHISTPYPDQEWRVTKVGDTIGPFPPNNVSFVVDALDFDKPSVTVVKRSTNRKGREIITKRELTIVDDTVPPPPQPAKPNRPAYRPAARPAPPPAADNSDPFAPPP